MTTPSGTKSRKTKPETYSIGGSWGDAIEWTDPSQFKKEITDKTRFSVHGWKQRIPKVGDELVGEFKKSTIWFRFVGVKPCGNPPDMFFAEVVPVKQEMK